jgi:hypothetical protein
MRPKKRMTLELSRARASNNRENKRPGRDEEGKRALQEDLRMYYIFGNCWLSWATAFTASLLGPSVCHPMSTSQDTSFMQAGDEDACVRLGPRSKGPVLGDPCFGARFQRARGPRRSANVWLALTRRRTWRRVKLESRLTKLKQQEVRAKRRRTNAGTGGMGAASHLAPWIWTWDEQERLQLSDLAADGRSELPH